MNCPEMKLCMFTPKEAALERGWPGRIDGERVVQLAAQTLQAFFTGGGGAREHAEYPLGDVDFRPPVMNPPSIRRFSPFGELGFAFGNTASIRGTEVEIAVPAGSKALHYGLAVAAAIGADGAIGGFTVANIWTARDLPGAKSWDFAISTGPVLVTPDDFPGDRGAMVARVNGTETSRVRARRTRPRLARARGTRRGQHGSAARGPAARRGSGPTDARRSSRATWWRWNPTEMPQREAAVATPGGERRAVSSLVVGAASCSVQWIASVVDDRDRAQGPGLTQAVRLAVGRDPVEGRGGRCRRRPSTVAVRSVPKSPYSSQKFSPFTNLIVNQSAWCHGWSAGASTLRTAPAVRGERVDVGPRRVPDAGEIHGRNLRHRAGSAHGAERVADLGDEQLRLLERGEVAAPVELVEVAQVGEAGLGPAPGAAEDLVREDRDAARHLDRAEVDVLERLPVERPTTPRCS